MNKKKRRFELVDDSTIKHNIVPDCSISIEVISINNDREHSKNSFLVTFKGKCYVLSIIEPNYEVDYSNVLKRAWKWYRSQVFIND